jgi:hypothetical protein
MKSLNAAVVLGGFALAVGFAGPAESLALPLAPSQPGKEKIETLTKQIEDQKQTFAKKDKKARDLLVQQFDRLEIATRGLKGSPELRASKIATIQEGKKAFVDTNSLPDSDEMLPSLLEYQRLRAGVYAPIAKSYKQLLDLHIKQGNDEEVKRLTGEKESYDKEVRGALQFATNTDWLGRRIDGNNTINCNLHIDKYDSTAFKGTVRQWGPGWTEGWKVEGTLDGMLVSFRLTQMVEGKNRNLSYSGYAFDNRLIVEVATIPPPKNAKPSIALLRLK